MVLTVSFSSNFRLSAFFSDILLLPKERWLPVSAAVTAGSLLEAWTSQIDNIILSPFLCSLLLFKCRWSTVRWGVRRQIRPYPLILLNESYRGVLWEENVFPFKQESSAIQPRSQSPLSSSLENEVEQHVGSMSLLAYVRGSYHGNVTYSCAVKCRSIHVVLL